MNYGYSMKEFYEAMENDLDALEEFDPAMEAIENLTKTADRSRATDQSNNKLVDDKAPIDGNTSNTYIQQVEEMTDRVLASIEKVRQRTTVIIDNTSAGNKELMDNLAGIPQEKIKDEISVINWSYRHKPHQYLHSKVVKLRSIITTNSNYLNNWTNIPQDALIHKSGKDLDDAVMEAMGAPGSVDTPKQYMEFTQIQFRGKKSELIIKKDSVLDMLQDLRSYAKVKTTFAADLLAAERGIKMARSSCTNQLHTNISEKESQTLVKLLKNITRMETFYVSLIDFIYRMHTEFILNRRAILVRIYEK